MAPHALSVDPIGLRLAPVGDALALHLPNVLLGLIVPLEEDAEHVGRHLVVSGSHLSEAGSADGVHAAMREDEPETENEAGIRVAGGSQFVDEGEVAVGVLPPHGFLAL